MMIGDETPPLRFEASPRHLDSPFSISVRTYMYGAVVTCGLHDEPSGRWRLCGMEEI